MTEQTSAGTRKRWLLWVALVLGLLVIAGGVMLWLASYRSMERASHQVQSGMRYEEVERLLGEPVKAEKVGDRSGNWDFLLECLWTGDDGKLRVTFTEKKVVWDVHFKEHKDPSSLQRVRSRLRSWLGYH